MVEFATKSFLIACAKPISQPLVAELVFVLPLANSTGHSIESEWERNEMVNT